MANPFERLPDNLDLSVGYYSVDSNWNYDNTISINDVKMWEQIYYKPGHVGIYVSYDPNVEFYMITYNFFIDRKLGIETFYGKDAVNQVIQRSKDLGIDLDVQTKWVEKIT